MCSIVLMGSLAPTSTSNCDDYTISIGPFKVAHLSNVGGGNYVHRAAELAFSAEKA